MKIFHTLLFFFAALFLFPVAANAQEINTANAAATPSSQIEAEKKNEPKLCGEAVAILHLPRTPHVKHSRLHLASKEFSIATIMPFPRRMYVPRKAKQMVTRLVLEDLDCKKQAYGQTKTFSKKTVKAYTKQGAYVVWADTFHIEKECRDHECYAFVCTHYEGRKGRIVGMPDTTIVAYGKSDLMHWFEIPQKAYHLKDSAKFVPPVQEYEVVTRSADGREEVSKVALTDKDIRQWYNDEAKRKKLVAGEWYRLIASETDLAKKEEYCREAYKKYPGVWLFANELQCILIEKGTPDAKMLFPYVEHIKPKLSIRGFSGNKPYFPFIQNHITACLLTGQTDSVAVDVAYLEKDEDTELTIATCDALAGYYKDALPTFQKVCPRNEFVLCMALSEELEESEEARMQYAQRALELALAMPEEQAMTHYFRAMAWFRQLNSIQDDDIANDVNHYVEKAEKEIKKAFEMDPSLKKAAIGDAMVNRIPYVQGLLNDYIHARGGQ